MQRFAMIASVLAFGVFNYAQYQGWSAFSDNANAQPVRAGSSGYRGYHK